MKRVIFVLLSCFLIVAFIGCAQQTETPEYIIYNTNTYVENGELGGAYRVIVDRGVNEDQLRAIAQEITADDDYEAHTVWFYSSERDIEILGSFTVAMAEGHSKGKFRIEFPDEAIVEYSLTINDANFAGFTFNEVEYTDVLKLIAVEDGTIALKKDGTIATLGIDEYNQFDVGEWGDIVDVQASWFHTVGLKKDGAVLATGSNSYGECEVSDWTSINQIIAASRYTAGLTEDGTVHITSDLYPLRLFNSGNWSGIVKIYGTSRNLVGLCNDGTVSIAGENYYHQCDDVITWTNIVDIELGYNHIVGIKGDGTVVAAGDNADGQCDVEGWSDIVKIAVSDDHTVGIKSDGTVLATGNNEYGQCDLMSWTNIENVIVSNIITFGVTDNGGIIYTGSMLLPNGIKCWKNISDIVFYDFDTIYGLRLDGKVVTA